METKEKKTGYDAAQISILEGLEAVRARPGMYIGSTNSYGLHHLVWEIIDNAVDEALNGHGKRIDITINKDGSISIRDEGRGIPVDVVKKNGLSGVETVFTVLHAGGKFGDGGYKASGGLHGVGASVTNALSEWLDVEVYRNNSIYQMRFENGGKTAIKLHEVGKTAKKGTLVTFKPDRKIFSVVEFKYDTIADRIQESAFLLKGVTFSIKDTRSGSSDEFCYKDGLKEYIAVSTETKSTVGPIVYFEDNSQDIQMETAFRFCSDDYNETLYSYANNVKTPGGGTHATGFRSGLTKAVQDFGNSNNLIKKGIKLEGDDIREGLTAVISLKIPENKLQFEGQTKDKLGTPEAASIVQNFIYTNFTYYLNENKDYAVTLIKKCCDANAARMAARKAKEEARSNNKKKKNDTILSDKLVQASSKEYALNELFIVEGDSAGGSAKKGRDRLHQAILPLRGKPLNVSEMALSKVMQNVEMATIIDTIGAGVGQGFDITDSHYGKIIIMTDADVDGSHIQTLLLNFFYQHMRPLITAGMIYVALPPLYGVYKESGKKEIREYAWNNEERDELKKKIGAGAQVTRYKGLGEMDWDQLRASTMQVGTRKLIQVNIDDIFAAERRVNVLMGKDAKPRKKWIEENVEFDVRDPYLDENIVEEDDADEEEN